MSDEDELAGLRGDEKIVTEAKQRFKRCEAWEHEARKLFIEDLKFVNGDSDNNYQWPDAIRAYRSNTQSPSPCLTINKTAKHCDMIINDGKQNKAGVSIRPVGDEATFEAAQVFEDLVRHIEYISNAGAAYDKAAEFQVQGGIGYILLSTDYVHDDTFDQEIYINPVINPLSLYLDPDCKQLDGSDARFGFEFDDMARDEFLAQYPKWKDQASSAPLDNADMWETDNHVRVAKYYRREPKGAKDELLAFKDPRTGEQKVVRASKLTQDAAGKDIVAALKKSADTKVRDIFEEQVKWYKIAGNKIIDRGTWVGSEVPIFPMIGKQTVIDGVLDRKGHTRAMKDPQRMYNFMASAAVEQTATQGKTPWIIPARAVEGYETYWAAANTTNFAYMPYNDMTEEGQPIAPPQRATLPQVAPAFVEGMKTAQEQMMMSSGQYQAQMGENENAKSGKAIGERQRQGDNATYHFIDNQDLTIRRIGKNLVEMIPKIYDTKRVLKIQAEDGTEKNILIDPEAKQAYFQKQQQHGEAVEAIFNPTMGKYGVQADSGPSYATKRQEAFNAFERIMTASPDLVEKAGDLMFRSADFPLADELAERLKRGVPPALLGEAPPPAVIQLQEQVQQMTGIIKKLTQEVAENALKLHGKQAKIEGQSAQKTIDAYDAESRRITAVSNAVPELGEPGGIREVVQQVLMEMLGNSMGSMVKADTAAMNGVAGGIGAQQ